MRSIIAATIAAVAILVYFTDTAKSVEVVKTFEPINGWANRLSNIPHSRSNRELHSSTLVLPDESGPVLLLVKYVFNLAQLWKIQDVEETSEEIVKPQKVWSNHTSKFVVYGESHSMNSSLGMPDPYYLSGVTHYIVPFFTIEEGVTDSVLEWTRGSSLQRKAIIEEYNNHGIRIGLSASLTHRDNPMVLAGQVADFARKYNFQGVDIEYKESDHFHRGKSRDWIVPLADLLRKALPSEEGYFLSHSPNAPLFNSNNYSHSYSWIEKTIGHAIDFYSIQMDHPGTYSTCERLLHQSHGQYKQTSLFQLHDIWGVPLSKIVIGRPAETNSIKDHLDHHMKSNVFAECLREASSMGWKGGAAWWNLNTMSIQETVQPVIKELSLTYHHQNRHHDKINTPKRRIARHAAKRHQVKPTSE